MHRATDVRTIEELRAWARDLHLYGRWPCDAVRRYAIGIYQLYQGDDWTRTDSENESYAAAAIHILAAAEALGIPTEIYGPDENLYDIKGSCRSDSRVLYLISRLQAQIIYATNRSGIKRSTRFRPNDAAMYAAELVRTLIGYIPRKKRLEAIRTAMEIMTGEL